MKEQFSIGQTLGQAFQHLDAGRIEMAKKLAKILESQKPEPAGLAYLLGLIALEEGQGKKAAQHLARALQKTPDAVPPMLAMARAQIQQGRLEEGRAVYRRLCEIAPDLLAAWRELADLDFAVHDFAGAAAPLREAVRLAPEQAALRNNLGISQRAVGDLVRAAAEFQIAIALDPAAAKPYANLAGVRRRLDQSGQAARRAALLAPEDAACRIEYGQALPDDQAIAEFQEAARLLPQQAEPVWLLAEALARLGREEEAAEAYRRVLALDPADGFGAQLALAKLGQGVVPERAAAAHVSALYDQYAGSFDQDLLTNLDYRGPEVILDGLTRAGIVGPLDILDAGCGTGLAGLAVKKLARRLDGIDLSEKMAEQARKRGVYDKVTVGDLLALSGIYDLVIAADVLIYLGDLAPVLQTVRKVLRSGGHFAFTVERGEGDGYTLRPTGRFAHAESYLRRIAADHGFAVTLLDSTVTRREAGAPVPGLLCLLSLS
ncbi:MAG TPA: tetratricopeptide repeat protein [Magnetospirillaceae bacterium]|nr:tetratricopeptide repeat protein [Magnetospirillaceae bacterium]